MVGDEVLLMTSLVLILAIFMRGRRSFFQRMQGSRNCKSKEMGKIVEQVWQIILPDYLAGVCHYKQYDWLRYYRDKLYHLAR
jgi:hypothetical protein